MGLKIKEKSFFFTIPFPNKLVACSIGFSCVVVEKNWIRQPNRTNNVVMAMLTYTHYMNICILFHAESFDDLNNKLISRRLVFLTMIIVVAVIAVVIEQLSSQ